MNVPSSRRVVPLIDARQTARPFIPGELYRDYPVAGLDVAEAMWADAREQAAVANQLGGLAPLEHAHWDWRNKAVSLQSGRFMLVGVECESDPQGLMAVERLPRRGRGNSSLVYVDYIETAPWNLRAYGNAPRFVGVGTALILDAVRLSAESGLAGRIGLHSLPQAEPFYHNLGLTDYGPDPSYFDLCYFEFGVPDAERWLASLGG
jgi:hypothetical protein